MKHVTIHDGLRPSNPWSHFMLKYLCHHGTIFASLICAQERLGHASFFTKNVRYPDSEPSSSAFQVLRPKLKQLDFPVVLIWVPRRGLEPPHPCGFYDLNVARLPISPPGHKILITSITQNSTPPQSTRTLHHSLCHLSCK